MAKYRSNEAFRTYLSNRSIVAAGYYDNVKSINLNYLLASWIDISLEYSGESFSEHYPYAADHFQVMAIEKDDPRNQEGGVLYKVVDEFRCCHHIKVWVEGELVSDDEIREIMAAMERASVLTET